MATVNFAKSFTLIRDDGRPIDFVAGEQEIDDGLVQHWFVQFHTAPPAKDAGGAVELSAAQVVADVADKAKPGRPRKV